MPGRFWFEIRGTERYHEYIDYPKILKKGGALDLRHKFGTDWDNPVTVTEEDYLKNKESGHKRSIYLQRDTEKLQRVDELICEFLGDPKPDIKRDSPAYFMCQDSAFWTLYNMGGSYIEEKHVIKMLSRFKPHWVDKLKWSEGKIARYEMLVEWVFLRKWVYQASG